MRPRHLVLPLLLSACSSTPDPKETPTSGTASAETAEEVDLAADCTAFEAATMYGETRGLAVFDEKRELEARDTDYGGLRLSDPKAKEIVAAYKAHFDKAIAEQPKLAAAIAAPGADVQAIQRQQLEAMNPSEPLVAWKTLCEPHADKTGTSKRAKCSALARTSYTALRFAPFNPEKAKAAVEMAASLSAEVGGDAAGVGAQLATDVAAIEAEAERLKASFSDGAHRAHHDAIKRLLDETGGRIEKACGSRF